MEQEERKKTHQCMPTFIIKRPIKQMLKNKKRKTIETDESAHSSGFGCYCGAVQFSYRL